MNHQRADTTNPVRAAGLALGGAAIVTIALMMLHPSTPHAGGLIPLVHGGMMLAIGAMMFGFVILTRLLGSRGPATAGLIAYAVSTGAHFAAATINGFAVPAMATWPQGAPGHDVFLLAWQLNQGFAYLGVFATGVAYLAWAYAMRATNPRLALAGALCGAIPAALLAARVMTLDVHGALLAYGLHGLWALAVGAAMIRGTLSGARAESPA